MVCCLSCRWLPIRHAYYWGSGVGELETTCTTCRAIPNTPSYLGATCRWCRWYPYITEYQFHIFKHYGPHLHHLQLGRGIRMSVDYCMTIVSQFLAKLLAANRSLSHANRVSGRSFPRSGETVFGRQRQKAPNCPEAVLLP